MTPEGRIKIDLYKNGSGIKKVRIVSTRPMVQTRLLENRSPEEALKVLPLIFQVCAKAQSYAAVTACERALAITPSNAVVAARKLIVLGENFREHALRVLMDWSPNEYTNQSPSDLKPVMTVAHDLTKATFENCEAFAFGSQVLFERDTTCTIISDATAFLESSVFGEALDQWNARKSENDLKDWLYRSQTAPAQFLKKILEKNWTTAGATQMRPLPDTSERALEEQMAGLQSDRFIAQPTWENETRETSALCRQRHTPLIASLLEPYGAGLLTRLVARLVEISSIPEQMVEFVNQIENDNGQQRPSQELKLPGLGVAQVEAARGRLIHTVQIKNELIHSYRILAPTEWNFHPNGPAQQSLETLSAQSEVDLVAQANILVTAIDPCVGYDLRIH